MTRLAIGTLPVRTCAARYIDVGVEALQRIDLERGVGQDARVAAHDRDDPLAALGVELLGRIADPRPDIERVERVAVEVADQLRSRPARSSTSRSPGEVGIAEMAVDAR